MLRLLVEREIGPPFGVGVGRMLAGKSFENRRRLELEAADTVSVDRISASVKDVALVVTIDGGFGGPSVELENNDGSEGGGGPGASCGSWPAADRSSLPSLSLPPSERVLTSVLSIVEMVLDRSRSRSMAGSNDRILAGGANGASSVVKGESPRKNDVRETLAVRIGATEPAE
jgi:hypothetical protein